MTAWRSVWGCRTLVADGAMGTMIQARQPAPADYDGHDGCPEILNLTRPDLIGAIHREYLAAGADLIETNTFGANPTALADFRLGDRIGELAEAGARLARQAADAATTDRWPRFVAGSLGPGTKLPTLGQVAYADLRDGYEAAAAGLIAGGVDALLVETSQDLLQAKAAVNGARRARAAAGRDVPIIVHVTIETTGVMLAGSDVSAVVTSLRPLGVEGLGLNCATGPAEMREHLRQLARHGGGWLSAMPNAGLPQLTDAGAVYPLAPAEFATAVAGLADEFGLALVGGCCGTTPEHIAALVGAVGRSRLGARSGRPTLPAAPAGGTAPVGAVGEVGEVGGTAPNQVTGGAGLPGPQDRGAARAVPVDAVASAYTAVDLTQDVSYLAIGERANANGSKAFREALAARRWDDCVSIAADQVAEGAHVLDLSVDLVGRDGAADMAEVACRLAQAVTAPIMVDSTEPAVIEAALERLPGRCLVNSVNFEDGDGPDSRYRRTMAAVVEHGAAVVALCIDEQGQARTAERKVAVARRLIADLTRTYGLALADIAVDCLTFPIATGQDETRRDGLATLEAIRALTAEFPGLHTTLGISNVSFGLNPAARRVLNSVFLAEARAAGLDTAIVHPGRIVPLADIAPEQRRAAEDLIFDRRGDGYDPLDSMMELFEGVALADQAADRLARLAALPVGERLRRRIVEAEVRGLEDDLDEALRTTPALEIVNGDLLAAMRTVGERFGDGRMQLPFVLKSAETMKRAVDHLAPHLDKSDAGDKGTLVLATVQGDVHDIGKNLVDIIVSNNGYRVVNLGIKQSLDAIVAAAETHRADAIGLSGLLVKSTQVMRDNLLELNRRGLAAAYPVLLGGAALTRRYVEEDLRGLYEGEVFYAADAFEGLRLMDELTLGPRQATRSPAVAGSVGRDGALPDAPEGPTVVEPDNAGRRRFETAGASGHGAPGLGTAHPEPPSRSSVARDVPVPVPPFYGSRVVTGVPLDEVTPWLDRRALFAARWGLTPGPGGAGYDELIATEGEPRLRHWLDYVADRGLLDCGVAYGYYPVYSEAESLVVLDPASAQDGRLDAARELWRFRFPRQRRPPWRSLPDFFRDRAEAARSGPDVLALQLVTVGGLASVETDALFRGDSYRDYFELHGLTVQLAEALAECWHDRVRRELGLPPQTDDVQEMVRRRRYVGERFSFGYPACPDLTQRAGIVALLDPARLGVTLSAEYQLHPEQSTDALIVHHPEARYFSV